MKGIKCKIVEGHSGILYEIFLYLINVPESCLSRFPFQFKGRVKRPFMRCVYSSEHKPRSKM